MRCLRFLILFLGLLGLSFAAPNGGDSQRAFILDRCRRIFKTACVLPTDPVATQLRIHESNCVCVPRSQCSQPSKTDERYLSEARMNNSETPINTGGFQECERSDHICCQRPQIDIRLNDTLPMPAQIPVKRGCGYRNSSKMPLQITENDNRTESAEFPWMVALLHNDSNNTLHEIYDCGGSIIHPRVVLTAAHCVKKYLMRLADLTVRAGDWNIDSVTETLPYQNRQVETIIIHDSFNSGTMFNDFAILILETDFDIAPNVNTVCLPAETDVFDGTRCTATGRGKNRSATERESQSTIKKVVLPVMAHHLCETRLRTTRLSPHFVLDQSFICAGGEPNRDTCEGDGGSPLVCPLLDAPDRFVQAGIVSWGIGCGHDQIPGVYAKVSCARRWIDSKLSMYGIETSSYVA